MPRLVLVLSELPLQVPENVGLSSFAWCGLGFRVWDVWFALQGSTVRVGAGPGAEG